VPAVPTYLSRIHSPLPDTFHGLTDVEQRYRRRYLDLLMNEDTRADFLLRARMVTAIRRALDDEGFVEVETPVLQRATAGPSRGRSRRTTTSSTRPSTCGSPRSSTSSG